MSLDLCPACQKQQKPVAWSLCSACLEKHGANLDNYPPWLIYAVRDNKRLFESDVTERRRTVPLGEYEPVDDMEEVDLDEPLRTRDVVLPFGDVPPFGSNDYTDDGWNFVIRSPDEFEALRCYMIGETEDTDYLCDVRLLGNNLTDEVRCCDDTNRWFERLCKFELRYLQGNDPLGLVGLFRRGRVETYHIMEAWDRGETNYAALCQEHGLAYSDNPDPQYASVD